MHTIGRDEAIGWARSLVFAKGTVMAFQFVMRSMERNGQADRTRVVGSGNGIGGGGVGRAEGAGMPGGRMRRRNMRK